MILSGLVKKFCKTFERLDIDDHRNNARRMLELLQHGHIDMESDFFAVILGLQIHISRGKVDTASCLHGSIPEVQPQTIRP